MCVCGGGGGGGGEWETLRDDLLAAMQITQPGLLILAHSLECLFSLLAMLACM